MRLSSLLLTGQQNVFHKLLSVFLGSSECREVEKESFGIAFNHLSYMAT